MWNVRVNFKTILILPSVSIIIIFKDACLVHFAHDPGKEVIEFPEITANKRAIIKIPSVQE